jgi:maltooligosyltrehalose synthase
MVAAAGLVTKKPYEAARQVRDTLDTIADRLVSIAALLGSRDELDEDVRHGAFLILYGMAQEARQVVDQARARDDQVAVPMAVLDLLAEAAEPRTTAHWEGIQEVPDQAPLEARISARRADVAAKMADAWEAARGGPQGRQAVLPSFFVEALIRTSGSLRGRA